MRNVLAALALGAALFASAGGGDGLDSSDPDGLRAWERHRIAARVPAVLFPQARDVRLYRCDCLIFAKIMLSQGRGWAESVALTPDEIARLRHSVFYAPKRRDHSLCIYPRQYAFLFFGAGRKLVGVVAVDEKYDDETDVEPKNPPSPDLSAIMIDPGPIVAIIRAHKAELGYRGC